MSEENKDVAVVPFADFTMKDLESIHKFREEGMLGLAKITDVDVERCMGLYVDGKTYRQIASILKIPKTVIMFLAHKFKWFELRNQYLEELSATLPAKILDSKLQSQEFFLELIMAYQRKISRNVQSYLRTDNVDFADRIDPKDISTIVKITELLHKLDHENLATDKSLVSLNGLAEGVTITKTSNNSVEITPKSPFSSKLKQFAELKRQQEKESQPAPKQSHDINVESKIDKESGNKNE